MDTWQKILIWVGSILGFFIVIILIGSIGDRYNGIYCGVTERRNFWGEYVEQKGLIIDSALIQTACYPTTCGCADKTDDASGCSTCAICGFDLGTFRCYEAGTEFIESDLETRNIIPAVKGKDYIINSAVAHTEWGYLEELGVLEGYGYNITKYDFASFLANVWRGNIESDIYVTICYTNYVELSGVEGYAAILFDNSKYNREDCSISKGNGISPERPYKSQNIQPGTHYITMVLDLDFFELFRVDGGSTVEFFAEKYEG